LKHGVLMTHVCGDFHWMWAEHLEILTSHLVSKLVVVVVPLVLVFLPYALMDHYSILLEEQEVHEVETLTEPFVLGVVQNVALVD